VVIGFDPGNGRSCQRSFTIHGDTEYAQRQRRELVDLWGVTRVAIKSQGARLTTADLLDRYRLAPHLWKPATMISHASVLQALVTDPIGRRRLINLTAGDVRAAISRWQAEGLSVPTVSGRWLVLRLALSWAVAEELLRSNPLTGVRDPARPQPRRHHSLVEVRQLLGYAEQEVERASAFLVTEPASPRRLRSLFSAEQDLLLVRLAADSGARRGELAVLCLGDLDGRVLTIERACPTVCSDPRSRPARDA
jgi:integrase